MMTHAKIFTLLLSIVIVLSLLLVTGSSGAKDSEGGRKKDKDETCSKVKCIKPENKGNCSKASKNDESVTQPEGGLAKCCPVWKCYESQNSSFVTFQGAEGEGTETVRYERTQSTSYSSSTSKKSDGTSNKVTSKATGKKNAKANAGTDKGALSPANVKDISKIFQSLGMSL